jgi:hypothetical protein
MQLRKKLRLRIVISLSDIVIRRSFRVWAVLAVLLFLAFWTAFH